MTRGKYAIVDLDDYERLSHYTWHAAKSKTTFYAVASEKIGRKWKAFKMHRKIMQVGPDLFVDHINHNGLDNRKANLRPATHIQNCWNSRRKKGANRFQGVLWDKENKKWRVRIGCNGKTLNIGHFDNEIEAAKAYDEAAKKIHGQFAVLNFGE